MLKTMKRIAVHGESIVDGLSVANFLAEIDCENLERVYFDYSQTDAELYKTNREKTRADQAEFEDMVYALQEEMIAERGTVPEVEQEIEEDVEEHH